MAQTTVFTCDICKQSKSKEDLAKISVQVDGLRLKGTGSRYSPLNIDICQDCLKKKGFVIEHKTEEELAEAQKKNEVTLEDKIYDLLSSMGVVFAE